MVNTAFLFGAIAIMLIVIARDIINKYFGIDIQKIDIKEFFIKNSKFIIKKTTGTKSLVILNAGDNKATVMATLRHITGIDYNSAKSIVEKTPNKFIMGISDKEAYLTRKALEFVGAKIEIKDESKSKFKQNKSA